MPPAGGNHIAAKAGARCLRFIHMVFSGKCRFCSRHRSFATDSAAIDAIGSNPL
jgi:hypothetical protein